jgi:ferredoxin
MKTVLYYLSATGNSLAVAKGIQKRLGDCELVSIPQAMAAGAGDRVGSDSRNAAEPQTAPVIGIVTPIYMHNMPHIVSRFIEGIAQPEYLFMVYAGGGDLGAGVGKTRKLFERLGLNLSALFNVAMPSNYTPFGSPEEEKQKELLSAAESRIEEIVETAKSRSVHFDGSGTTFINTYLFPGPLYQLGYRQIPTMDRSFTADDRCTSCGICEEICPVGNISLIDGWPVWNHRCEQCFACLQWCPVQAIEYGKRTHGVDRYHHPEISLKEIRDSAPRF